jgi:hypothetical protein
MAHPQDRPDETPDTQQSTPGAGPTPSTPPAPHADKAPPTPPAEQTPADNTPEKSPPETSPPSAKAPHKAAKKTPGKKAPAKAAKKAQQASAKAAKKTGAKKAAAKKAAAKKAPAKKAPGKKAPANKAESAAQPKGRPPTPPRIDTNGHLAAAAKDAAAHAKATVDAASNPVSGEAALLSAARSPVPLIVAIAVSLLALLLIRQLRRRGS